MGILNVTPDSFSDGGKFSGTDAALQHAMTMLDEGADIIDVGGESTRPGSAEVSTDEELRRVIPVITALRAARPSARVSIDTRHPEVASAALNAGADIVNDITGLTNPAMRALCAESPCGIILMHMQGTPATMQQNPQYVDVVAEVRNFFTLQVQQAAAEGISQERICLDPGIGFGKTTEHNLALIRRLAELRVQNLPLMMALSRKRFIGEILGDSQLAKKEALPTVVMSLQAAANGADVHRVHDVGALRHALTLRETLQAIQA